MTCSTTMKPLILIGGGGHCKSVIEVAESVNRPIRGILDLPSEVGKEIAGYPVIGTDDTIPEYIDSCEYLVTIGFIKNPEKRIGLYSRIQNLGGTFATLIASTAHVSRHACIGPGSVVMHNAFVNTGAKIGNNVIINTFCNIEHDVVIGNHCHISTGTMVNGDCKIGDNCFIGSQSVIVNGIHIGKNIIIGAGSTVPADIETPGIYIGSPVCRKIQKEA